MTDKRNARPDQPPQAPPVFPPLSQASRPSSPATVRAPENSSLTPPPVAPPRVALPAVPMNAPDALLNHTVAPSPPPLPTAARANEGTLQPGAAGRPIQPGAKTSAVNNLAPQPQTVQTAKPTAVHLASNIQPKSSSVQSAPKIGDPEQKLSAASAVMLKARRGRKKHFNVLRTAGARLAERFRQARRMPAWLISFIVHLLLLLILAIIPLPGMKGSAINLLFSGDSAGIADFSLSGGDDAAMEDPVETIEVQKTQSDMAKVLTPPPVQMNEAAKLAKVDISNLLSVEQPGADFGEVTSDAILKSISNGLRGRQGESKSDLLRKGGGSKETEDAVELGLKWLAQQQQSDGGWSLKGPYADGGTHENRIAATAMALNAFLGAGYSQVEGKYSNNVKLGLNYLIDKQDENGLFSGKDSNHQRSSAHRSYAQALATISVLEAFGLSNDYKLVKPSEKAIKYAEWAQSPKLKGWRYEPRQDSDLSVTGWYVMALQTGKLVGLEVQEDKLQSVHDFLDSVAESRKSRYAYNDIHKPDLTMTAEGLLCRIWLGWPKTHPALSEGVDFLISAIPQQDDPTQSIYYWYYATQVMHHFGGEAWNTWNAEMKKVLPAMQTQTGDDRGSWDRDRDIYGNEGGRLYTTCLAIYCLEVYYRHLAIYDSE